VLASLARRVGMVPGAATVCVPQTQTARIDPATAIACAVAGRGPGNGPSSARMKDCVFSEGDAHRPRAAPGAPSVRVERAARSKDLQRTHSPGAKNAALKTIAG